MLFSRLGKTQLTVGRQTWATLEPKREQAPWSAGT